MFLIKNRIGVCQFLLKLLQWESSRGSEGVGNFGYDNKNQLLKLPNALVLYCKSLLTKHMIHNINKMQNISKGLLEVGILCCLIS
jgi:hypothetical protein